MTTFVDAVTISGVKAISGTISLDLKSPLVVVYAPNGTGKTSIWHAISAVIADFREEHLQCKVKGAKTLNIVAKLRTREGSYEATRYADQRLKLQLQGSSPIAGTEALKLIAPECSLEGMQTRGAAIQSRLQEYIRSTRTLPSDSLSYLIDDKDASIALRRQIFADLTGTSGLQVEQRELNAYISRLSAWRDEQSRERTKRVADHSAHKTAGDVEAADADKILAEAATALNVDLSDVSSEMLPTLRSRFSARFAEFELKRKQIDELKSVVAQQSSLVSADSLTSELTQTRRTIDATQLALSSESLAIQNLINQVETTRARSSSLENFLLHAEDKLSKLLSHPDIPHSITIGEITRRTAGKSRSQLEAAVLRIDQNIYDTQTYEPMPAERDRLAKRTTEIIDAIARTGNIDELTNEVRHIEAEIQVQITGKAQLEALKIQLTDAARQILSLAPSSKCPCCSHQWPSTTSLADAVEVVAKQEQGSSGKIVSLQEERLALTEKISALTSLRNELSQLTEAMNSLSQKMESLKVRLSQSRDLPAGLSELRSLRETENTNVLLIELLDMIVESCAGLDQTTPLGSLVSHIRAHKQNTESDLIKFQADLNVARGEEKRLRTLLDESRKSANDIEEKTSNSRMLEARRSELISALGLGADLTNELHSWQVISLQEEKILEHVKELLNQATESLGSARSRRLADDIMGDIQRLQGNIDKVESELLDARRLLKFIEENESDIGEAFFTQLGPAIATLFSHMQVNKIFKDINITTAQQSFSLTGSLDKAEPLSPGYFSHGQQQDLALAMFLARACTLGGSYFLDEPLLHLDDLNRTALLDCIRACVIGTHATDKPVNLLVTTANWSVARQFIQKFSNVKMNTATPALTVYGLTGNVNVGVSCEKIFQSGSKLLQ